MLFNPEKCYWVNGEENNVCLYDDLCDDFLHSQGAICCGVVKATDSAGKILNVIVCDANFLDFDQNTRAFCIYHEVGHVKYNHTNIDVKKGKRMILYRSLGFLPKMEVQADCYAASVIGKNAAKAALRSMISNKQLPFMARVEVIKRYFRVKEIPLV